MYLYKVAIKNFRLLEDVVLFLEERTTVIVGRNNSGKTSLTELFRRLSSDGLPTFRLEDFSLSSYEYFWKAFVLKNMGHEENEIRGALPIIELRLTMKYDIEAPSFGPLRGFIIDLNPKCTEALIVIRYQLKDGQLDKLFDELNFEQGASDSMKKTILFQALKDRIPKYYTSSVVAVDPNDETNQKVMEWRQLRSLLQGGFINAQRGLDDTTHKDINLLGKILEALLDSAMADSADPKDRDIVQNLERAIASIQSDIDDGFNKELQDLLPAISLFGYPGLSDPHLITETTLDVQRLMKNHTKIHYAGVNGINLPEAYNGLGVRNLIFIFLKLYEFFKLFITKETPVGINLVFIEEPEVHLHPQMQEVFISNIDNISNQDLRTLKNFFNIFL